MVFEMNLHLFNMKDARPECFKKRDVEELNSSQMRLLRTLLGIISVYHQWNTNIKHYLWN